MSDPQAHKSDYPARLQAILRGVYYFLIGMLLRFFDPFIEVFLSSSERGRRAAEQGVGDLDQELSRAMSSIFTNGRNRATVGEGTDSTEEIRQEIEKLEALRDKIRKEKNDALERNFLKPSAQVEEDWRKVFLVFRRRLLDESERLRARSVANLGIGLIFSIIAVISLLYALFGIGSDDGLLTVESALVEFLPRLTLVILLQIVAGFFFKVYSSNESDLKQNKNEISNLDYRYVAAIMAKDGPQREEIISHLLCEERNFVLHKGDKVAGKSEIIQMESFKDFFAKFAERMPSSRSREDD